jgi:hypothetical protein
MYTQIRLFNYSATCVHFHLPNRQTEGVVRAHAKRKVPSIPAYSTIQRRINKLDIKINELHGNDMVIALVSTGIKITNRREWLPHSQMECKKEEKSDTHESVTWAF